MRRSVPVLRLLVFAGALAAAGCGTDDRVPVYPVSGRVAINGRPPVGEGWMAVLHREPAPGPGAEYPHPLPRAKVGADGRFQFRTYGAADGAPAGTYRISFVDLTEPNGGDAGAREKASAGKEKPGQLYWPGTVEVPPQPTELPPFDIKR